MSRRNKAAQALVVLGSIVLLASTAVHTLGAYPNLSRTLATSSLPVPLQQALRAVFLLAGWDWIAIAVVALVAAFTATRLRKTLVLFCSAAVAIETAVTLAFIGLFIGNELIGSAALLLLCGGLLFESR